MKNKTGTEERLDTIDVLFSDTHSQIRLNNCPELASVIKRVCPGWPFEIANYNPFNSDPFLSVNHTPKGYQLSSVFMTQPKVYKNAVDAVCAMIVELAWATLRDNPEWLCLHCAAVEFAGRLVIFPNARRAGKSTISTLLGLRGHKVFTDDFLALDVSARGEIHGLSSGISTRMRMPWPDCFSNTLMRELNDSNRDFNKQYSYHSRQNTMPVPRGTRSAIGAVVLLERRDECELTLSRIKTEKTLQTIILQNFARATNSANILDVLYALVSQVPCYELSYENAQTAVLKLEEVFQGWTEKEPLFQSDQFGTRDEPILGNTAVENSQRIHLDQVFTKNSDVVAYSVGDQQFLATPNGKSIFQLDGISTGVWNALDDPTTPEDIIDLFCYAFPDQTKSTIEGDIVELLMKFEKNGMIMREIGTEK